MTRPEAVIFDCDGVLVDSEPHSVAAWLAVLADLGHPGTAEDIEACTGLGFAPTRDHLGALAPLPSAAELWPRLLAALAESFDAGLRVFADAGEVRRAVAAAGLPTAVVSASPRARLDLTLTVAGLEFSVSVAGDEVAAGKPAPDGYLAAARLLAVAPGSCVVIEDSPTGVAAAVAAGMRVVAVDRLGDPTTAEALARAGATVVDPLSPSSVGLPSGDDS